MSKENERACVDNVFMFCEPISGWRKVAGRDQKTKVEWANELAKFMEGRYAHREKVLLVCDNVCDNLHTHTMDAFHDVPRRV